MKFEHLNIDSANLDDPETSIPVNENDEFKLEIPEPVMKKKKKIKIQLLLIRKVFVKPFRIGLY